MQSQFAGNIEVLGENCLSTTLSTTYPTGSDLGLNSGPSQCEAGDKKIEPFQFSFRSNIFDHNFILRPICFFFFFHVSKCLSVRRIFRAHVVRKNEAHFMPYTPFP